MTRDDALDAALVVLAAGLHVLASRSADFLPPAGVLDVLLGGSPLLAAVVALVLLQRGDRRGLHVACVLQWLVVLFTIAAISISVTLVPSAVLLTLALLRPRLSSARPAAG